MQLNSDSFFYNTTYSREKVLLLIDKAKTPKEFRSYISTNILKTNRNDHKFNEFREEIYMDIIGHVYKLGLKLGFCIEKFSTLFSIIDFIFNENLDQKMTANDGYEMLKKILLRHLDQCEPYSIGIFSEMEYKEILMFMRDDFFRYFSLYEVCLTKFIDYNIFTQKPMEEEWPIGAYESLDQGELIEPSLVKVLEEYFANDVEETEIKPEEEKKELQLVVNEEELKNVREVVMTEEMKKVEKEVEEKMRILREGVGNKLEVAEKNVKELAEDIINPKKKK